MTMHYLLTLPYLAFFALLLPRKKNFFYPLLFILAIFLNLPLFEDLSINDFTFSFIGNLSFVFLAFCTIILLETTRDKNYFLISQKGLFFLISINFLFFLTFLNIIPINLYYQDQHITLIIACCITIIAYFFDRILAILYLLTLFVYTIRLFDSNNILDYFFDLPSILVALIMLFYSKIRKK
ncbi:hypothetical protein [Helicobacter anatolicus]|uniref:hypothetical protein n=1 Tax=Helicobacter anatolicus TaxID=2905874 RepID=UPI001E535B57|nr:hypothetical protein [Helicobacter anatolicus]MCE3039784.1 hypothetical protein [Helicobacter anatolicus]